MSNHAQEQTRSQIGGGSGFTTTGAQRQQAVHTWRVRTRLFWLEESIPFHSKGCPKLEECLGGPKRGRTQAASMNNARVSQDAYSGSTPMC